MNMTSASFNQPSTVFVEHHQQYVIRYFEGSSSPDNGDGGGGVDQNIYACIALMTLSGFLRVSATMALAFPDFLAKQRQQQRSDQRLTNRILDDFVGREEEEGEEEEPIVETSGDHSATSRRAPGTSVSNHQPARDSTEVGTNNNDNKDEQNCCCCNYYCFVAIHVLLLFVAAIVSVVGTFYGPVSIAIPVQTGSQLLFNVIAMGLLLRMRYFNKSQRTGTYVVFFSVLSLVDVGPNPTDNQDILHILSHSNIAITWSLVITLGLIVTTICTIQLLLLSKKTSSEGDVGIQDGGNEEVEEAGSTSFGGSSNNDDDDGNNRDGDNSSIMHTHYSFSILLAGVTFSNVAMATSGKMLGSFIFTPYFGLAFIYYVISAVLGLLFSITSSTACEQGLFTPASSVALIIVNFITGILIWEDWKVMTTWVGYICSILLMCCGVYLLAEIDLFEKYLVQRTADMVIQVVDPQHQNRTGARGLDSEDSDSSQSQLERGLTEPLIMPERQHKRVRRRGVESELAPESVQDGVTFRLS